MKSILSLPKKHPFLFGVTVATTKTGAVDFCIQNYVEKNEKINWTRVLVFSGLGLTFNGSWQYFLFVKAMPRMLPNTAHFLEKPFVEKMKDRQGLKEVMIQLGIENGINNPILYFPIFYTIQESLNNGFTSTTVTTALTRYSNNFKEDMKAMWQLWIPAQFINFMFSPLWMRVPFVAVVSALWTSYVSISRGKYDDKAKKPGDAEKKL